MDPNGHPPCSGCTDHVCHAERDAEYLLEVQDRVVEARHRPAGRTLNAEAMLNDIQWLCDRVEALSDG